MHIDLTSHKHALPYMDTTYNIIYVRDPSHKLKSFKKKRNACYKMEVQEGEPSKKVEIAVTTSWMVL